jgi:hypothetical protein
MSSTSSNQASLKSAKKLSYIFSSICLVHCLTMPFIIILIPAFSHFMNETVELILILSIIPISLYAFVPTWVKHRNILLGSLFITGVSLIFFSQFGMAHLHALDSSQIFSNSDNTLKYLSRSVVMITGVIFVAFSVYKNNKHTHVCDNPHHHH